MNARSQTNAEEVQREIREFRRQFRTLILATASDAGTPNASYAPYIMRDGSFYILVSQLAKHTSNLMLQPTCHAMFIENEESATNLFARRRLTCQCAVKSIARDSAQAEGVFGDFTQAFGPVVSMLTSLPDFLLFELQPLQCSYVRGFGQAMTVDVSVLRDGE